MSKALLHELGKSLSYGRLSLLAKVLWPMLLATSDDQGRGTAEPDAVKWYVCPNVPEITIDAVPGLLQEMQDQGMILLYHCDRGTLVYQTIRWWEYQSLRWARPSRFSPPDGWTDKIRYSDRGKMTEKDWNCPGGFCGDVDESPAENCTENCTEPPAENQLNLTQSNLTQLHEESGEAPSAVADPPAVAPPQTLDEWIAALDTYGNHPALVRRLIEIHYPGTDPPDYGQVGAFARKMGQGKNGYKRLITLIWQCEVHKPNGDLLPYLLRVHQGKERDNGSGTHQRKVSTKPVITAITT